MSLFGFEYYNFKRHWLTVVDGLPTAVDGGQRLWAGERADGWGGGGG